MRVYFFQVEEPLEDVVSALLSDEESSESEKHLKVADEHPSGRDPPVEAFLTDVLHAAPLSFHVNRKGRALSSVATVIMGIMATHVPF